MISFETWFANIASTADLIASEDALWRTWVQGDKTITSAYDYSELAVQVLDDLELENLTKHFSSELRNIHALEAFVAFGRAFLLLDQSVQKNPILRDPIEMLKSSEWSSVVKAAQKIVALPTPAPYRRAAGGPDKRPVT